MIFPHFIKMSVRNFKKYKKDNIQKSLSLVVSFSLCIVAWMFIQHEFSFDNFYDKQSRLFRINTELKVSDLEKETAKTSDVIGPLVASSFPEVESYVRVFVPQSGFLVKKDNFFLEETSSAYVDSTFFDLFEIQVLETSGDPLFTSPNSVVITESMAKKYFGKTNAVGQLLEFDKSNYEHEEKNSYVVSAVIKDFPDNSHINFSFLLPIKRLAYGWDNYVGTNFYTYITLKEGNSLSSTLPKIDDLVKQRIFSNFSQQMGIDYGSWESFHSNGHRLAYTLIPINRIHLESNLSDELTTTGNKKIIYIISLLVILVWLVSCINFSNISLVQIFTGAKRIGIQKILGASQKGIVTQCLLEGIAIISICLFASIVLVGLCLPLFNDYLLKSFSISSLINSQTIVGILALFTATCVICLSYSCLHLITFRPFASLKSSKAVLNPANPLTRGLVIFQFSISIIFIGAALIIYQQLTFMENRDSGYSKDQVLVIDNLNYLGDDALFFKENVLKIAGVKAGTLASSFPMDQKMLEGAFTVHPGRDGGNLHESLNWFIDESYFTTLGIEIVKGRNFSQQSEGNFQSVLINESMEKLIGNDAVGKTLYSELASFKIVGVVKDFNHSSLREAIKPIVFNYAGANGSAAFKIEAASLNSVNKDIERLWNKLASGNPLNYHYLEETYSTMYKKDQLLSNLIMIASCLSIFIATMGLYGFISFSTNQRSKEISIRKVLGASGFKLLQLISTDFIKLIVIAAFISIPVSWWLMSKWLDGFVYRIDLELWMFIMPASFALLLTYLTSFLGTASRIKQNPIRSLKE